MAAGARSPPRPAEPVYTGSAQPARHLGMSSFEQPSGSNAALNNNTSRPLGTKFGCSQSIKMPFKTKPPAPGAGHAGSAHGATAATRPRPNWKSRLCSQLEGPGRVQHPAPKVMRIAGCAVPSPIDLKLRRAAGMQAKKIGP